MPESSFTYPVSLTANLGHQLEQAVELRRLAYEIVIAEHRGMIARVQNLATAIFYRSLQTHEAAEILVRQKLVEDARVLVRVLVEQAVNFAYMLTVGDDSTVDDFLKFPKYWRYKILQGIKAADETRIRNSMSPEEEEQMRQEHEALKPRFKGRRNGEWCGKLHERAAKVDEKLGEALRTKYGEFLWMVNSEWRFASSYVHGMADSLLDQVTETGGVITIEQKFDDQDAATALYSANFAIALCVPLLDNTLGGKHATKISLQMKKFTGH
jgi:Family of unknown function (DUF5677)